jgi:hypothetical protein
VTYGETEDPMTGIAGSCIYVPQLRGSRLQPIVPGHLVDDERLCELGFCLAK